MNRKELLYKDLEKSVLVIYEQYQFIIKGIFENKENTFKNQLKFSIKNDFKLGGKAWCENNLDNIQINKGVIDNFFEYFYELTKKETEKFLNLLSFDDEDNTDMSYEMIKFDRKGLPYIYDSKVIDLKLANLLTIFVARFIITHELGHILNGHCEFLNSKDEKNIQYIPMFSEDNKAGTSTISPLDFRALEMDADAFAATDNLRNLILLYSHFEEEVDRDINIEPIELFYWWSFAIRSNFLITQNILNDEKYRGDKKHLPSVTRWVLILDSFLDPIKKDMHYIDFRDGDNKEKLLKLIVDGFTYAERCYNEKNSTNFNCYEEIKDNKDFYFYVNEAQQNWEIIRKELEDFSRLPLYQRER